MLPGHQKNQFISKCREAAQILLECNVKTQKIAMLEQGLSYIFEHLDKKTRKGIFIAIGHICDARQTAEEALISDSMMKKMEKYEAQAYIKLAARNIINIVTANEYATRLTKMQRKKIIGGIVTRLIMELDSDEISVIVEHIFPSVAHAKEEERDRHMFG